MSGSHSGGHPKNYTIDTVLKAGDTVVQHVTVEPGGTIPPHAHATGYVVHPHTDMHIVRTTHQGGAVIHEETVTATASKPYFVPATAPGTQISIRNLGSGVIVFGKQTVPASLPQPGHAGPAAAR